jgi:hypothetical protein
MAGPKSPLDPRKPNDERLKNTFSSEGEATAQKTEMNSKRLYNLYNIKVQRMDRMK